MCLSRDLLCKQELYDQVTLVLLSKCSVGEMEKAKKREIRDRPCDRRKVRCCRVSHNDHNLVALIIFAPFVKRGERAPGLSFECHI